jgi:histidinol-phosphatase (PHP family)
LITNYHQHSEYSDGHGSLEDFARVGLSAGMAAMGFSDHAPLPFDTVWTLPLARLAAYRAEIEVLKKSFAGRLELYAGLELDYLPEDDVVAFQNLRVLAGGWDYVIGSMHYLGREPDGELWSVDVTRESFERGLETIYGGDIRRACDAYYAAMRDLARDRRFDVVGHLDYTKRFNVAGRYYDDESVWYRRIMDETLRTIAARDVILEVNAGGWRAPCRAAYPAPFVLRRACELGVRVTLSADAHRPEQVVADMGRLSERVRAAGYTSVTRLLGGQWRQVELGEERSYRRERGEG